MQGLDLTFETLGNSRNEAAVDVLVASLAPHNTSHRQRVMTALISRSEPRAPELLLQNWSLLQEEDIKVLRGRKTWMTAAIEKELANNSSEAVAAAEALGLASVLPTLILLAESAVSRTFRRRASEAVLKMVEALGTDARNDRDQTSVRGPVIARLADSLRRFSMHRNQQLVEAFLVCSSWSDGEFRQVLADNGPESDLICEQLSQSTHDSVLDLLAGFLKRRNVPERILQIMRARSDKLFRAAFLRATGLDPTPVILKNLREMGMPQCCQGGEGILDELPADTRSALAHVHVACSSDYIETLHLIAATAERGTRDCVTAATIALSRCEIPNARSWMQAALYLVEDDPMRSRGDETSRLLQRLIHLLEHPDPGLHRSIRRALSSLHATEMLPHFQSLRPRSRRRLGCVVMMIDPDAIDRVRDALRHPVLSKRLDAIAMADALGVVDLLYDLFAHITREDHQEARMRAAEAMSEAKSDETLQLLEEMVELPECPVRDTAILAIQHRQQPAGPSQRQSPGVRSC